MATAEARSVMKAWASFGPGGAAGVFIEKLAHVLFKDAYEMEDPSYADVRAEDTKMAEIRKKYVEDLFDSKGDWNRKISNRSDEDTEAAYKELESLILKNQKELKEPKEGACIRNLNNLSE